MSVSSSSSNLYQVINALKNIIGLTEWHARIKSSSKLDLIKEIQPLVKSSEQIKLADAMSLLVDLHIITEESAVNSLQLSAQIIPSPTVLTFPALSSILTQLVTKNPKSSNEQKKKIARALVQLGKSPNRNMTIDDFFTIVINMESKQDPTSSTRSTKGSSNQAKIIHHHATESKRRGRK